MRSISKVGQEFFDQFEAIAKEYLSKVEVTQSECDQIKIQLSQVQMNLRWAYIALIIWQTAHPGMQFTTWSDLQTRRKEINITREGIQVFLDATLKPKTSQTIQFPHHSGGTKC